MSATSSDRTLQLVRATKAGDVAARDELAARLYPLVCRIVSIRMGRTLKSFVAEEDVVQEAVLSALRGLPQFAERAESTLRHWLATVVENSIRDQRRRSLASKRGGGRVRRAADLSSSVLTDSLFAGRGPSPSQAAARRELEERVERALLQLDERARRAITMRRLCGLPYDVIARELELGAESSARALVARALAKLSSELKLTS